MVSGTYSAAFVVDGRQHAAMMGVHFRPGGAPPVLGVPAAELTDRHVDLADLRGAEAPRVLRERLCGAPDQAHLTNEFGRLCGITPRQYQRALAARYPLLRGHVAMP